MSILRRTAALAAVAAAVVALAACTPAPVPEPTTPASTPATAVTPEPTADASAWESVTAHCDAVGRLMQVDPSVSPQVHGYAPVDLQDSGPRDGARGEVRTRMDDSPYNYTVAEGDRLSDIGGRFCAPDPDYLAWLNDADDADALALQPGDRLWLVPNEPA